MEVEAGGRIWIVPPGLALWLPPRVAHEIRMHGRVLLRTLYIEPDYCPAKAPSRITLMRVSSLLRELIERACALPIVYETSGRAGLTMALIMQEFEWLDAAGLPVLKAEDRRLRTIVESILADPGLPHALNALARLAGASPRTIARLCRSEFGMSFGAVRHHLRLIRALPRLLGGQPITTVALDAGYDSAAAFSTAFRKRLGVPPSRYLSNYLATSDA
jgi:AraC-like DNA-binding protein